ncbi:hypothetical protein P3S67_002879 [Capsicum chacoense]
MPPPEDATFDAQLGATNNNSEPKGILSSSQGYKVAIVGTASDPNNKFAGAGMTTSIWKPPVEDQQHSACRSKIQKGSDIIQVGWRVDPPLYGDHQPRRFIHFQAGNNQCFNTLCPGFIIMNSAIAVDMAYLEYSIPQVKVSKEETMFISRDPVGNWWLLNKLVSGLQRSLLTNIEWGGVVYSPSETSHLPAMGSGFWPNDNPAYLDATCRELQVVNGEGETIYVGEAIRYRDDADLYRVTNLSKDQHLILYGGPFHSF